MTGQTAAAIVGAIAVLVTAYVTYRKLTPETSDIRVTTADKVVTMSLGFAEAADKDNDDLREQLKRLSEDFAQYRHDTDSRLAELSTRLRAAIAENVRLEDENGLLRGRVDELESEVARLKAER